MPTFTSLFNAVQAIIRKRPDAFYSNCCLLLDIWSCAEDTVLLGISDSEADIKITKFVFVRRVWVGLETKLSSVTVPSKREK